MSFKVIEDVIRGKLAVVKRTDRSKQLYARFRNAKAQVKYSYLTLNTTNQKKAFDLALAKYDELQKGKIAFKNAEETFDLYVRQAFATYDKKVERGQMTKLYAKLAKGNTRNYALKYFGLRNVNDITSNDLDDFIDWCFKQRSELLSTRTIEKIRDTTNAVFREAERSIKGFVAPKFRKDTNKGAKANARPIFEQTELITMARRAKGHWLAHADVNKNTLWNRDGAVHKDAREYKNNEKFLIKGRNYMYFRATNELKMQFADEKKYYSINELQELWNFITFMVNTYLRPSEWSGVKVKHIKVKPMTKAEIELMKDSSRKALEKRDKGYAKFSKLEMYVVDAKNKKNADVKRVFYRGSIDTYYRQVKAFGLKANDYLFFNHLKNRKHAKEKMADMFDAFLIQHDMKKNSQNETRTMYSLRHSGILMSLNAGVDVYLLASNADTGVKMIEQYYGSRIKNTKTAPLLI